MTRAYVVFTVAIITVITATMISATSLASHGGALNGPDGTGGLIQSANHNDYTYTEIFFEVSSAFGTTGLSTGITPNLSMESKLTLILVMFIGQLGVSSSILV